MNNPVFKAAELAGVVDVLGSNTTAWPLQAYFPRTVHSGSEIKFRLRDLSRNVAADNVGFDEPARRIAGKPTKEITAEPIAWRHEYALSNSEIAFFRRYNELQLQAPGMAGALVGERDAKLMDVAGQVFRPVREGVHRVMSEALRGTVNYKVGGVEMNDSYGLTALDGVSASWATASTDIPKDMYAILDAFEDAAGVPCDTIFYSPKVWTSYFTGNTAFVAWLKANPELSRAFIGQGGTVLPNQQTSRAPFQMFGVNWVPVWGSYTDRSGATQQRWPVAKLTLAALNSGDGVRVLEWGSVRDEYCPDGQPASRMRQTDNPITHTAEYADNGVPIIRVPERVAVVDLVTPI